MTLIQSFELGGGGRRDEYHTACHLQVPTQMRLVEAIALKGDSTTRKVRIVTSDEAVNMITKWKGDDCIRFPQGRAAAALRTRPRKYNNSISCR